VRPAGKRPPVILLHGVGLDHTMWDAQVAALGAYFEVLTPDLVGHGTSLSKLSSPRRRPGPSSLNPKRGLGLRRGDGVLDFWLDQLHDLAEPHERLSLVGFSFGGLIAQSFAAANLERIDRLVLMNTVYDRSPDERAQVMGRLEKAEREGPQSITDAAIARWFSPEYASANPSVIDSIEARLRGNDAESFLAAYEAFATADEALIGKLADFPRPALVMTGELDTGSTPAMARALAASMPNAESFILPGGRHMMPVERADDVNARLMEFLAP
jgi:(E)-2-((N-methylformamido)methylene)succinate hydrolase